jgi:Flp pilus assembly protein TadB
MNIAHIESKAVSGDHRGVQLFVRRFAACCLIGVAAMSAAQAGPRDRERESQRAERVQRQGDERQQRQYDQRQGDDRQQRQYDDRQQRQYDEQRRNQQAQDQQNAQNNAEAFRRSGRLTPDERRDLRRQINEAGADIYPNRRR